jgi:hypothetical protein
MSYNSTQLHTQNDLLLKNLMEFYKDRSNLERMMHIVNGESKISLRIIDWFVTNYSKKYYTIYSLDNASRFKVYNDYKLKLKAYAKNRFDPFCRWERIRIPYDDENFMETTIGQLNFFKWALENKIIDYIDTNYEAIESDMNARNTTSKNRYSGDHGPDDSAGRTRKKREELSISACKCIKKEEVKIVVTFN